MRVIWFLVGALSVVYAREVLRVKPQPVPRIYRVPAMSRTEWNPEWGEQPAEPERAECDFGPPGYTYPPAQKPPINNGHFKCPKCREVAAYHDTKETIRCRVCKELFHFDFALLIAWVRVEDESQDDAA